MSNPIALIRRRQRQGIKAPGRRGPIPPFPHAIERHFEGLLVRVARKAIALTVEALRRPLADFEHEQRRQDDAALDAAGELLRARVEFMRWIETEQVEKWLVDVGEQLDLFSVNALKKQLPAVIPLDAVRAAGVTEEALGAFTREGVDLIKSIGSKHFDRIQGTVAEGFQAGRRAESIAKDIQRIGGVTRRRAEFIARDQVGKLNGRLTEERQRALGGETYIWRASGDSRVRERHRELDGQVFRWDDPPILDEKTGRRGHPGFDFQCRCRAELDVDAVLSALEAEDVPPVAAPAEAPLPLAAMPEPMAALPQPFAIDLPEVMQFAEDPLGRRRPIARA